MFPPGRKPAGGRVPDHSGDGEPARRGPVHHGGDRRGPARTALSEIAGLTEMTSSTLARPASRCSSTSRAKSTAPRAMSRRLSTPRFGTARRPADPADLSQGQPGRAPVLIMALTSTTLPAERHLRRGRYGRRATHAQVEGVAEVTVNGAEQPAIRVGSIPTRLAAMGVELDDVRKALAAPTPSRPSARSRERRRHDARRPTTSSLSDDFGHIVVANRHGAVVRFRDIAPSSAACATARRRLVQRQAGRPRGHQARRRQRDRDRRPHQRAASRAEAMDSGRDRDSVLADRTGTIRASVRDMQWTLLLASRW